MHIFMFKSEAKSDLRAFAGDSSGSKLPAQHGPWQATGVIRPDRAPPHNLSRRPTEKAINGQGFQLWRVPEKKPADGTTEYRRPGRCHLGASLSPVAATGAIANSTERARPSRA